MTSVEAKLAVRFDYPVLFTRHVFSPANAALIEALTRAEPARRHRLVFAVEQVLAPVIGADVRRWASAHAERIDLAGVLVLEGGEAAKGSIERPLAVAEALERAGIDRQSFVVIAGGGAFLDMVGFAAAITHRGVRVVRLPTTVLAQADSGVGVKNGINAFGKKNFLGAFAAPFAVVVDFELLSTLTRRDRVAGMSEAVKVALIRDPGLFEWIRGSVAVLAAFEPRAVERLIRRSAELHVAHITGSGDPFEMGTARPLDFGHWAAHKLEALSGFEVRHGEAVAIGIALDTFYSVEAGHLDRAALEPIAGTLEALGFRLWNDHLARRSPDGRPAILEGLREFREHLGGELTLTMLKGVGEGFEVHAIEGALVEDGLRWLRARDARR